MEHKQEVDLKLCLDKPSFFVDDFISGALIFKTEKPSIIERIVFEIIMVQEWKLKLSQPQTISKHQCLFALNLKNAKCLMQVQDSFVMPGGENKISFKFKFGTEPFPCFEYPLNEKYAFIRYRFNIKIDSCNFKKLIWNNHLHLLARPVINLQNEYLSKTVEKSFKKLHFIDFGTIVLSVTLPDNNVKYDSEMKVIILVDNTYGKEQTKEVKIKFQRIVNFLDKKQENKFTEEYVIYTTKIQTIVMPGKKETFECMIPLKENNVKRYIYDKKNQNPYDINPAEINYYMPTLFSDTITCKYDMKFTLYFKSRVGYNNRPRIRFPIYIVHQGVLEYQTEIEKQIEFEKSLKENNKEKNITEQNNNNQEKKNDKFNTNNICINNQPNNFINNNEEYEEYDIPTYADIQAANSNNNKMNDNSNNQFGNSQDSNYNNYQNDKNNFNGDNWNNNVFMDDNMHYPNFDDDNNFKDDYQTNKNVYYPRPQVKKDEMLNILRERTTKIFSSHKIKENEDDRKSDSSDDD